MGMAVGDGSKPKVFSRGFTVNGGLVDVHPNSCPITGIHKWDSWDHDWNYDNRERFITFQLGRLFVCFKYSVVFKKKEPSDTSGWSKR